MPTYEFRCPEGHEFERFYRKISDAVSEVPCPECGKIATRQLSAGAGFVFKGSGFYLTDYGKNAHRKGGDAKPDKSGESSGGESKSGESKSESTGGEARSDSKAASKSDAKPAAESATKSETKSEKTDKPAPKTNKAGE